MISVVRRSRLADKSAPELKTQSGWRFRSPDPDDNFLAAARPPKQLSESESELDSELQLELTSFLDFLFLFFGFFFGDFLYFLDLWRSSELEEEEDFFLFLGLRGFDGTSDQLPSVSSGGQFRSKFGRPVWVLITLPARTVRKIFYEKRLQSFIYKIRNQKKHLKRDWKI